MLRRAAFVIGFASLATAALADAAFRLGTDVVPRAQAIHLALDPAARDYAGSTTIDLAVERSVPSFRFHAQGLTLDAVRLARGRKEVEVAFAAVAEDQVEVTPHEPLTPGRYTLTVRFRNDFDTQANALYKVVDQGRSYLFTQFQDVHAREAFPCWDEPAFKIPFTITLTVPRDVVALSNARVRRQVDDGPAMRIEFRPTKPLPAYLIAVAVGPFDTVPIPGLGVPGRVIVPKGRASLAADAVAATPPILAALEDWFGRRYPYDKLDLIAAPEYWYGAMENPGAIVFRESILLLDPERASPGERDSLRNVLAHEIAHMWFGDLVTMTWWDDMWLSESFATWTATRTVSRIWPESRADARQVADAQVAYGLDALPSARAIRQPVTSQSVLAQAADPLAYQKGEAVLRMFERWIGADTFRKGVNAYLREHAWGDARAEDLWRALATAARRDVGPAMSTFLDRPGVPVVSVESAPGGKVRLRQERYRLAGAPADAAPPWRIPVTIRVARGTGIEARSVLLDRETVDIDFGPGSDPVWIHPNASESGYYRWRVPETMLLALVRDRDRLDPRERIGLPYALTAMLDDATLDGGTYLGLLETLAEDGDPAVAAAVAEGIRKIEPLLEEDVLDALRAWVRRVTDPWVESLGTSPRAGESAEIAAWRPRALELAGDLGRDPDVLAFAGERARVGMMDAFPADPDLYGVFLRLAAIDGNDELFDAITFRLEKAAEPTERATFLAALGGFRDPALVQRTLEYIVSGPLRPNEIFEVPSAFLRSEETAPFAWAWLKSRYDRLGGRVPPFILAYMPWFAVGCDAARLQDATAFFAEPRRTVPGTQETLKTVGDAVAACVRTKDRLGDALAGYLTQGDKPGD